VGVKHGDLPELLIGTGVAALVFSVSSLGLTTFARFKDTTG